MHEVIAKQLSQNTFHSGGVFLVVFFLAFTSFIGLLLLANLPFE
ncbi:MAG: hypothetical protein E6778_18950 [Niallia nealsonii]|nr:hypothetical protein [Niallia nealsonii]MED3792806.1 hypothetical protein [Niallia alba]